jgi:hypothetical protein
MDGTEGDGWCPNATERARLRLELAAVRAATAEAAAQQQAAAEGAQQKHEDEDEDEGAMEASARVAEADGKFQRCGDLYARAASAAAAAAAAGQDRTVSELARLCDSARASADAKRGRVGGSDGCHLLLPLWRQADLLLAAAHCQRRARDRANAAASVAGALRLFPRHGHSY